MPAVNFRELLTIPTDAVERPKAFPDCWLNGAIGNHEYGESKNKKTPYVRFTLRPESLASAPDGSNGVTEDDLAGIDFSRRELRKDFFITPSSLWRLSDFLDAVLGKESGRTFNERIPDTRNASVIFHVTQREAEGDSETIYNDVQEILAA